MENSDLLRHQKIKSIMAQQPTDLPEAVVELWSALAAQIISIVGESGFNSVYERSIFLCQAWFPWLEASLSAPLDQRFSALSVSLKEQKPADAVTANTQLLITFTDIINSLIGEDLTTRILCMAWDNIISMRADKELNND